MTLSGKQLTAVFIVIIALSGFAVYLNSLPGPLIWDDIYLIKDNPYVTGWKNLPKIFLGDIGAGARQNYGFYRPLQVFSYLIDRSVWGDRVMGYHLTSVVLHILVALSVFWMASILFKDELLAFLAGLLYAIHPVHTEAVAYISGRTDPLSALFMLAAFIFYVKGVEGRKAVFYAAMALSYMLALLSRECALTFPALVLVYHYSFGKKVELKPFGAIISISLIYIMLRYACIGPALSNIAKYSTAAERLPGFFVALAEYARLTVFPIGIHMAYGQETFYFTDARAITGVMLFIGLVAVAAKAGRRHPLLSFSVSWFLVGLIPVTNIFPELNAFMAAHWLYIPSIGFFLIVGKGLAALYVNGRTKVLAALSLLVLVAFYSLLTVEQNNLWNNPARFFERTMKYAPASYRWKVYYHLANEMAAEGRCAEAIGLYKKTLSLNGYFTEAYNRLGEAYARIGEDEKAISAYRKAIWTDPAFAPAYKNLSHLYTKLGREELAAEYSTLADKFKR